MIVMADVGRRGKAELIDNWCWRFASEEDRLYHDGEWGMPVHDDRQMFEHLSLECLQCGLSWNTILLKRLVIRTCFADFDIDAVAAMDERDVARILAVPGMLRSPRKTRAIIGNAAAAQRLRREFGSLCAYFWSWTDGKTILYQGHEKGRLPTRNGLSERIAHDLKARGFSYVGPVNIYAHLQACGIVCDHAERCPRYAYVTETFPCVRRRRDHEG
ncbi:DNA-3-methyladenine glycosylase I [Coriobacteriales bacterium OH1046]|nr:DNA-3-methyladenine glycosylase I [Coriobacteriales bacterium OH1046]